MRTSLNLVAVALAIALAAVFIAKNIVAKAAVEGGVRAVTGLPLKLDRLHVGLFTSAVGIYGMRLHNPAGFPDAVMMDVPEVYVHYDLPALLTRKVHLQEVRLNLKEFIVVKQADGRVNLDAFKAIQTSKKEPAQQKGETKPAPTMQIDHLHLKIGKVVYKDYTGGGAPQVQEFPINIDEHYQNITNPYVFGGLIVSRALMSTTVAKLTGLDIGPLQSLVGRELSGVMGGATEATQRMGGAATGLTGTASRTVSGAADAGKEAVSTAAGAVKGTAGALKKLLNQ